MQRFRWIAWLMIFAGSANLAWAQNNEAKRTNRSSPLLWSTETIMEGVIKQITRYYNLTEDQEEYTRLLMSQRVKSFLGDHEADLRMLLSEYMEYRMNQEMPSPEVARQFADRAGPLMGAIREEIFRGNMEWREVLNEEQKKLHDRDLNQMTKWFENVEGGLDRWAGGDVRPADVAGRLSKRPQAVRVGRMEDAWDYYVRHFIQMYQLDEGQQQVAYSILRDLKTKANRYRESHKERFDQIEAEKAKIEEARPKEMSKDERDAYFKRYAELNRQRERAEKPLADLFDQLRRQLETIPTADQRRARREQMDRLKARSDNKAVTRPADVTTQPVAEEKPTERPEPSAAASAKP